MAGSSWDLIFHKKEKKKVGNLLGEGQAFRRSQCDGDGGCVVTKHLPPPLRREFKTNWYLIIYAQKTFHTFLFFSPPRIAVIFG